MDLKNQKNDHVVIVTSAAEDAGVKKFRFKPWMVWTAVAVVCVIIGALLGYIAYEEQIWENANQKMNKTIKEYEAEIKVLEENNKSLQLEIEGLNSKVTVLSDTITQMKATEEELTAEIEKIATPTLVPITGSATIQELQEGDPISIFTAAEGAVVVSTASGIVSEVGEDTEFGHRIVVDHGNGYKSVYKNNGTPLVKLDEQLGKGYILFTVGEDNQELAYQIIHEEEYIDPMLIIEING